MSRKQTGTATVFQRLRSSFHVALQAAADVLLPPQCAFCEEELTGSTIDDASDMPQDAAPLAGSWSCQSCGEILLCRECSSSLIADDWQWCPRCGSTRTAAHAGHDYCLVCRHVSFSFSGVVPLGQYRDALRDAVLHMKRPGYDHLSTAMARLYALRRGEQLLAARPDVVVPVPMYWTRQIMRGTNSAEILAMEIARILGIPTVSRAVIRCRNTLPQKDLLPEHRMRNVRGAFRPAAGYDIQGARVLLVDDIMTTGATCREIALVLKRAGAKSVTAAVLARAEGRMRRRRG